MTETCCCVVSFFKAIKLLLWFLNKQKACRVTLIIYYIYLLSVYIFFVAFFLNKANVDS